MCVGVCLYIYTVGVGSRKRNDMANRYIYIIYVCVGGREDEEEKELYIIYNIYIGMRGTRWLVHMYFWV